MKKRTATMLTPPTVVSSNCSTCMHACMHAGGAWPFMRNVLLIAVVIKSTGKSIRGLLVLQDPDKTFGDFPYLPSRSRLNDGLIQGFCGDHSVSHK